MPRSKTGFGVYRNLLLIEYIVSMESKNYNISIADAITTLQKQIEDGLPSSLFSGFDDLDKVTTGWFPGELCVVGARPGMGKTCFILNVIANMLTNGDAVALFSATDSMNIRFMARVIGILNNQYVGFSDEKKIELVEQSSVMDIPFYLNLEPRMSLPFIRENAIKLVKEKNVKCLFVETIQSISDSEDNGNTKEGMERICKELKILAYDLNIPIIVTSELNRNVEYREGIDGKYPQLCDLRSSSAIEYNADSVYLLFRPAYYHILMDENGNDLRYTLKVIVAKNKYGNAGEVNLRYNAMNSTISDMNGASTKGKESADSQQEMIAKLKENESFQKLQNLLSLEISDED